MSLQDRESASLRMVVESSLVADCERFHATLCGERPWRNIQPILLASFTSVAQLLAKQATQIQELQQQLSQVQASLDRADARLACVVTHEKLACALQPLQQEMMARMDGNLDTRAQQAVAEVLTQIQERYVTQADAERSAEQQCTAMSAKVSEWRRELECEWRDFRLEIEKKATTQRQHEEEKCDAVRAEELRQVHGEILNEVMAKVRKLLDEEANTPCIRNASTDSKGNSVLADDLAKATLDLQTIEAEMAARMLAWRQELALRIDKKPCKSELEELLRFKMDALDASKQLAEKADNARLEEITGKLVDMIQSAQETSISDMRQIRHLGDSKADASEVAQLKQHIHELLAVVESLQQESSGLRAAMTQKLSVEDAKQLIESRTTLAGLETAMQHMETAMSEDLVAKDELQCVVQQVHAIKQQLRSEMYQARYIWKDGRPSQKQTISWNARVVSTNADIFIWKTGSDQIMLKIPGLYHVQAAFFTDFSPTIQVLINGEPGLVLTGEDSQLPSAGTMRSGSAAGTGLHRVHHSAGNIVGVAVDAFLALPARAIVQISYDIDEKAQGFLNLRKL